MLIELISIYTIILNTDILIKKKKKKYDSTD